MPMVFGAGVLLAILFYVITAALHLLNQPSDAAVAAGYLICFCWFQARPV